MTPSELERLLNSLQGSSVTGTIDGLLQMLLVNGSSDEGTRSAAVRREGVTGADRLVGPAPAVTQNVTLIDPEPKASATREASGSSTAETVLKTAGMVTGVGPLVTGLLKLFGESGTDETSAAAFSPIPFSLPEQISVQAGLLRDRSLTNISYGHTGVARELPPPVSQPSAPQINVNVQAMDTRSFLDHSDEIARAVRDAMLRSHTVNDVIGEL